MVMSDNNNTCYFCEQYARVSPYEITSDSDQIRCNECGYYILPSGTRNHIEEKYVDKKHIIAGYLWNTKALRKFNNNLSQEDNVANALIDVKKLQSIMNDPIVPKTIIQKIEKLLIYLHKRTEYFGFEHKILDISPAVSYAANSIEIRNMFAELVNLGFGEYKGLSVEDGIGFGDGIETPRGYIHRDKEIFITNSRGHARAEKLISANIDSKKVFVAMGFKDDLLAAMDNAIRPACKDCGFDAFIITDREHNNGITDEIIVAIKTSKFIITDFTYNNCGAYFEAGYAQGHGLEVIRCCKKEWFDEIAKDKDCNELMDKGGNKKKANQLHFDVGHYNFIIWEDEADLKKRLVNRIRAIIPDAKLTDDLGG